MLARILLLVCLLGAAGPAAAGFDESDDRLWRAQLAKTTDAGFIYAVTYLVTCARKP